MEWREIKRRKARAKNTRRARERKKLRRNKDRNKKKCAKERKKEGKKEGKKEEKKEGKKEKKVPDLESNPFHLKKKPANKIVLRNRLKHLFFFFLNLFSLI